MKLIECLLYFKLIVIVPPAIFYQAGKILFFPCIKNPTIQHEGMYTITHIVLSGPGNDYPAGIRADKFFMI